MSTKIDSLVSDLLSGIAQVSNSETIVGEPQKAGDATIIPIHKLKIAFAVGQAKADAKTNRAGGETGGMAAAGAVELDPVAAIAVGRDGSPRILTVDGHAEGTWSALLQEVPDLMSRVVHALGDRVGNEVKDRLLAEKTAAPTLTEEASVAEPAKK